ncbi:MAG: phage portal protein [Oscillospiraceae bacterium]|nr:phage portal protein [Oscillospiraceae bacterium]
MGLLEKIFPKYSKVKDARQIFRALTAYQPTFTSWNGMLYESDLVRAAIHAKAKHASKLQVQVVGSAKPKLQTALTAGPNEWQTWGQFLYRTSTILDMQNTAFVVPVTDYFGVVTGIYTVLPSSCEVVDYQGEAWLRYQFSNGDHAAIPMRECGILTKFQYRDDFFGESNTALSSTMDLIHIQNQGISEGVKNAATYRFYARVTNFSFSEDLVKERKRFTRDNLENDGGGILLFPNTYDNIQQIDSKPFVVDADQMTLIQNNVFNYLGVNMDILQNKAVGDTWSAFYEGETEYFAIQLADVLTKMLFTPRERSQKSGISITANRMQYMSNADKLNVSRDMADRGLMMIDEIREIWNLPPLPNGKGQVFTLRGEYYLRNADGTTSARKEDPSNAEPNGTGTEPVE